MNLVERAAYLKGLADGIEISETTKEGKLLKAIVEVLNDMASTVDELEDFAVNVDSELDEIAEELINLENIVESDCDCDCDDEWDECDCSDCDDCQEYFYSVVCPTCNEEITIDESILDLGKIDCPNCGEELEFDMSEVECDCDECSH